LAGNIVARARLAHSPSDGRPPHRGKDDPIVASKPHGTSRLWITVPCPVGADLADRNITIVSRLWYHRARNGPKPALDSATGACQLAGVRVSVVPNRRQLILFRAAGETQTVHRFLLWKIEPQGLSFSGGPPQSLRCRWKGAAETHDNSDGVFYFDGRAHSPSIARFPPAAARLAQVRTTLSRSKRSHQASPWVCPARTVSPFLMGELRGLDMSDELDVRRLAWLSFAVSMSSVLVSSPCLMPSGSYSCSGA